MQLGECKHWKTDVGVPEAEAFVGVKDDVGACGGFMVSKNGYTRGARNLAKSKNITLFTVDDTNRRDWLKAIMASIGFEIWVLEPTHFAQILPNGNPQDLSQPVVTITRYDTKAGMTITELFKMFWTGSRRSKRLTERSTVELNR